MYWLFGNFAQTYKAVFVGDSSYVMTTKCTSDLLCIKNKELELKHVDSRFQDYYELVIDNTALTRRILSSNVSI